MITPKDVRAANDYIDHQVELAGLVKAGQRMLEGAPLDPPPAATGLLGWDGPHGLFVCSHCAGRILARGCHLNMIASCARWADQGPAPACNLCTPPKAEPVEFAVQIANQLNLTRECLARLHFAMDAGGGFIKQAEALVACFEEINRQMDAQQNP